MYIRPPPGRCRNRISFAREHRRQAAASIRRPRSIFSIACALDSDHPTFATSDRFYANIKPAEHEGPSMRVFVITFICLLVASAIAWGLMPGADRQHRTQLVWVSDDNP